MATTYKVLGQSAPAAATPTTLYSPSGVSAIVSTINVVNVNSASDTIRISVRPGGASQNASHYIVYELTLAGYSTFTYTAGITLATTDVVTVYSTNGHSSFSAFGSEVA